MVSILHVVSRDYYQAHSLRRIRALQGSDLAGHEYLCQLSGNVDFFSSPRLWREDLCAPGDINSSSGSFQVQDADATYLFVPSVKPG